MWMNEKRRLLAREDFGQDEDSAIKLLNHHKALQSEIDTYRDLVTKLGLNATNVSTMQSQHPLAKKIEDKQVTHTTSGLAFLHLLVKLVESRFSHDEAEKREILIF